MNTKHERIFHYWVFNQIYLQGKKINILYKIIHSKFNYLITECTDAGQYTAINAVHIFFARRISFSIGILCAISHLLQREIKYINVYVYKPVRGRVQVRTKWEISVEGINVSCESYSLAVEVDEEPREMGKKIYRNNIHTY